MALSANYPSLRGKVVLITGGASGIGACFVRRFIEQGARTAFIDRDVAAAEALIAELEADGLERPWFRAVDVTEIEALQGAVEAAWADHGGRLDVLVNNAADDTRHAFAEMTPEAWDRTMAVNLSSQVFALQAAARRMEAGASIINLGSTTWRRRMPGMVGYTSAKAAIHAMTRTLAQELGGQGIRVNSLLPGPIETERQTRLWATPEMVARFLAEQALKIRLVPDDVAAMALFLAADDSRGCTGQDFLVDGGIV
jgi:NAD(P)-dependent dehydrogenase (short-subunit alcohol dehydrogenase family)